MNWLARHAAPLEACAAMITAAVAVAALVAIPLQIKATAQLQAEQSGRDIYREFLALSMGKPAYAAPDYCTLKKDPVQLTAYGYYVEYLVYTAEQTMTSSQGWASVMHDNLSQHLGFLCENGDFYGDEVSVNELLAKLRATQCSAAPVCSSDE